MEIGKSFFDAHTHIQFPAYDVDRDAVISRAKEAGVSMILVGTQAATSEAGIVLAGQHPGDMWAAVGYHPAHAMEFDWYHDPNEQASDVREVFDIEKLRPLAEHENVVAIGECGLDYFRMKGDHEHVASEKEKQKEIFLAQIQLAQEVKKPLMIHCRAAFSDLISMLNDLRSAIGNMPNPGVIHFFTGTPDDARMLLDLGFSFTFGGVITFARNYDEVIKLIPMDRILSETDAPYVAPAPYRGKRNEPAYVVETVKKLAELKGVSVDMMVEQIAKNAQRIFGVDLG